MFFDKPAPPASDAAALQSLAVGVLALCSLCEDLLSLAAAHEAAPTELSVLAEQLEAVRASAAPLVSEDFPDSPHDPYSLSRLGDWVWRE